MKKLILVAAAALALPLAACQKAEEATVVEAVPADEAASANADVAVETQEAETK